jgi:hypothetical protein
MPCCDTGRNIQKYKGAAASTLQDVTDNGNTTTGDIITTSGYFIGDGSKLTNVPGVSGAAFTLQQTTNKGNVTTDTVEFQNSITSLTASGNVLVTGNVTASVFYGDGGLLSNTATTPTLQTVTTIGNTTTNTIDFQNSVTSLTTSGNVLVTGNVTASKFYGDGLGLTSLNASSVSTGTLLVARGGTGTTTSTGSGSVVLNTNPTFSGTVQGGTFSGSGSGLTSLNAGNISTGTLPVARGGTGATTLNNLIQMGTHTTGNYVGTVTGGDGIASTGATSGEGITHTLSVDRKANGGLVIENNQLAVNLGASAITGTLAVSDGGTGTTTSTGSGSVVLNTNPTLSGTVTAGTFSGSGSGLTSLNATNISTGTLPVARGGTGATTLNNLIQMGTHTTGNYVATITGGNGISSTGATSGESITHTLSVDTKANGGLVMENNQLAVNLGASAITGTLAVSDGGTGTTTSTGSGSVVLNTNPTFSGTVTAGTFSGSGSGLTSLNATNISTGTLPVARGGTGLTSFVSGDLIYANGTSSFTNLASNSSTQGYFLKNDNGTPTWADVSEVGSASPYSHFVGTGLSGGNFNGSSEVTWTVDFGVVATTSNLNSNVTRIYNLETNLNNNSARITTITNDLTNNVSRIGNLETNLTNNSARITTVTNDLTNNVNRIGNLETNLTNNSGRITTVTNDLTNNSNRITTVTNDLTNNVSRISTLENETQPVNRGGTELTSYAIGDILYASGTTTLSKLGIGLDDEVLTVSEGTVSWQPGTGNISLNQAVNVSNSTSNVVQFTGADYDTSFVTSKKVGIANTAPTHTLDVGSNVSIIDDGIDKLVIRGNCYVINDIISLGTIHTDILKAKDAFIKNTTVVAERPTRQVRLN